MLELPLDIIEKIIISSDRILTTYNSILTLVKTLLSNYNKLSQCNKLKYNNNYQIYNKYQHYLSIYLFLLNNTTKLNIYKQSGWYNYFIDVQKQYSNNNILIEHINKNILNNLNIIQTFIDCDKQDLENPVRKTAFEKSRAKKQDDNNKYMEYITYIESTIDTKNTKLLIQEILVYWNINITELGSFILLNIILLSSTTFKTKMNNLYIENHLYMKFIKEKEDIISNRNMNIHIPCYFNPNNNIIPLFQKYIGLGYTYNIAWDILIRKYISFLFGGSSAEDFEYFDNKLKIYLQKNKTERLEYIKKYKKIININKLIEVLVLNDDKSISYYEQLCIN